MTLKFIRGSSKPLTVALERLFFLIVLVDETPPCVVQEHRRDSSHPASSYIDVNLCFKAEQEQNEKQEALGKLRETLNFVSFANFLHDKGSRIRS